MPESALDPILLRQLRRLGLSADVPVSTHAEWQALLQRISSAYADHRQSEYLMERSLHMVSKEMQELYAQVERHANERLRRFFEMSRDLLCVASLDGYLKVLNPSWTRLLGFAPSELQAVPFAEFIHPDDQAATVAVVNRLADGEPIVSFENRYRNKGGDWVPLRWNAIADLESGLIYASARDIAWETEARDLSVRIVEASPSGMILVEAGGTIALANAQAERLFGYAHGELIGMPVERLVPTSQRLAHQQLREGYESVPVARSMGVGRDLPGLTKDAELIPLEIALNPVTIAGSRYVLAVIADNRARKQFEAEMRMARDAALKLAQVKADFLANMSHEIRTPLNAVIGLSGLLMETSLDDLQREYASTVRHAGNTLLTIINEILDFSKIEAGKLALEEVLFNPRDVLDESIQIVAGSALAKGLVLSARVHPAVPAVVRGDPGRVRQVLMNLLGNAVKFTTEGRVDLVVGYADGVMEARVIDTGVGIPAEVLPTLFRPFSQGDTSMARRFGGSGLGLAISQRLVDLMGGGISVQSAPGAGSEFRVTLPLAMVRARPELPRLQGRSVAVLSSRPEAADHYAELLEWEGAVVVGKDDLGAADALVADLSEAEVAEASSQLPAGVPVVRVVAGDEQSRFRRVTRSVRGTALVDALASSMVAVDPGYSPKTPAATTKKRRILLVEDNWANQMVGLALLRKIGHEADAVGNGLEALRSLEQIPYDLVLMDCQMPEMDGFAATREWRRREKGGHRLPIVALTASALEGDRQLCLDAGMDDYIAKPITKEQLTESLGRFLPP